jgi:hypothetical protein
MTLHEMQRRLKGFSLVAEVADAVDETKEAMVELNRQQLLRGLDREGNYLSPKYSEDPYFKSKESAKRYAAWKKKIEPVKTDRPEDVPNLYIIGTFHSLIDIDVNASEYTFSNAASFASDVENKFQGIYGLTSESKSETYIPDYLLPAVKRRVVKKLGFKFG